MSARTIIKIQLAGPEVEDLIPTLEQIVADLKDGLRENDKEDGNVYLKWEAAPEEPGFTITPGRYV